jgi:hypothetical protein
MADTFLPIFSGQSEDHKNIFNQKPLMVAMPTKPSPIIGITDYELDL